MAAADKNLATGEEELKKNKGAQDTNDDEFDNAEKYSDIEEEEEEEESSSSEEEEEEEQEDQLELTLRKMALESKNKKELTDAEIFDFPEDPENWTEEDLQEIWADAHPELIDDIGWDPDVVSWSDWDQIQDLREKGEKVTTEPFYVPYRKYYPPSLRITLT